MKKSTPRRKKIRKKKLYRPNLNIAHNVDNTNVQEGDNIKINLLFWGNSGFKEQSFKDLSEVLKIVEKQKTCWLNIEGFTQPSIIEPLVEYFKLHELSWEAILNTSQRTRLDDYGNYIHITSKIFYTLQDFLEEEQITIIFNEKILITFQEKENNIFSTLRNNIINGNSPTLKKHTDYLAYTLLDIIIDQYFVVIEHFEDHIDHLETKVLKSPSEELLTELNEVKQEISYLRRTISPLREALNQFEQSDSPFIHQETIPFIRNLRDYSIQVIETINIYKDSMNSLTDLYMSSLSNKMNNIMKVLTIVSTIFIPLTFIVGVYGMNFANMPELEYRYGYYATLIGMGILTLLMIVYFKYKKWL